MARYGSRMRYGEGGRYGDTSHPVVKQLTDAVLWASRCYQIILRRRC